MLLFHSVYNLRDRQTYFSRCWIGTLSRFFFSATAGLNEATNTSKICIRWYSRILVCLCNSLVLWFIEQGAELGIQSTLSCADTRYCWDTWVSEKPNTDLQHIIVLCVHNTLVSFLRGKQGIRTMQSLTAIIINNVLKSKFIALRLSSQCIISEMSRWLRMMWWTMTSLNCSETCCAK